ncbi:hypothetical protein GOP47_0010467 [Adiantum capillus-veneris]|uniref:Uncharacterized protein n=1 Tax=Adiantum capillus-veneris TaxID=13818 RepID=A0A9D4UV67_ADICA|nr:hypothetical protein GOP47_0010467 [Adiantum capillus-veneris]
MLLEGAMAELRHDAALLQNVDDNSTSPCASPPRPQRQQTHHNAVEMEESQHSADIASPCSNTESSPFSHGHSKASSSDEFSSSNAGSSSISTRFCDDASTNEGVSLLQDDNEFVNRVLNREPSNLGESNRFGGYRSTAAVAASGVPFQWEAEPGKCKAPTTIKEEEEEEEQVAPLNLPPIRLAANAHMPPHMSPSHSTTSSPRSLAGKVKSFINHVKKPSIDHFSFSNIVDIQKSPSRKSLHRAKKGRRNSSLSASDHGSLSSTPYSNYTTTFNGNNGENVQRNEELYAPRASLNSSDPSSSPYYFSPLSNTSSYMSQGLISPRISVAQSLSGSSASITHPQMVAMGSSHTSSRGSNSSISSISSGGNVGPTKAPALLANCLLTLAAMADDTSPPALTESGESDHQQNGNSVLSFASPEMEILDEEGLLTSANFMGLPKKQQQTTMAEFINRGGPAMNRSLSTSRVTFADDLYRKPAQKSKYYSAQLSNLAQPKSTAFSPMKDASIYNAKLDVLFPLKRPNLSGNLASKYVSQSDESSDDRQAYADALDTSLDCSVVTDNEELNNMVPSMMKEQPKKERPAHEVVMHANDENGYAYSPIASAFVFSPRKSSQNGAKHYFKPSTRANIATKEQHCNGMNHIIQPKSILKKTYSQELNCTQSLNANGAGGAESVMHPPFIPLSKSLSHTGSQKISSVLLRFAEAEEQLHNSKKLHHNQNGMRSSPACIQPMCSFLGRALLCRSKLASHAGRLRS